MKLIAPKAHDAVYLYPVLTSDSCTSKTDRDLQRIQSLYGKDALKPRYLSSHTAKGEEEVVLVPKLRYDLGEEAWEGLSLDSKLFITKLFYEKS